VYEGQWVNDVKHGMGVLVYPDGETIKGYWQNDRLNGLATVHKKGFSTESVIFKDDLLIRTNSDGIRNKDIAYLTASIFLVLIFYGALPLGVIINDEPFWTFLTMFISLSIYIVWSCCHDSTKYIYGLVPLH
jgi:hypothetical protein